MFSIDYPHLFSTEPVFSDVFNIHTDEKNKRELNLLSLSIIGGEDEIRTRGRIRSYVGLANRWFQPLTHLSNY